MKSENSTAQIKCTSDSHIHFIRSQYIHITNLEFVGCGGNRVIFVEEFVVQDAEFQGQENSGTALELIRTTAQTINSTFISNRKGSYRKCVAIMLGSKIYCLKDLFIGGAIIVINSRIDISQSKFENNRAEYGGVIFAELYSIININDTVFINNNAIGNGAVLYSFFSFTTIEASDFYHNSATYKGGVVYSERSAISIEASEFLNNSAPTGGVLYFGDSEFQNVIRRRK